MPCRPDSLLRQQEHTGHTEFWLQRIQHHVKPPKKTWRAQESTPSSHRNKPNRAGTHQCSHMAALRPQQMAICDFDNITVLLL